MFSNVTQSQRRIMLPLSLLLGGGVIIALLIARFMSASANSGDIASAEARYAISGSAIDNCALCHAGGPPALNPYGAAYKAAGRDPAALAAIEGADSDGDGFTNLEEFTARTYPGDASSFPAPTPTPTSTTAPTNTPTAQPTSTPTGTTIPGTATNTPTPTSTTVPGSATPTLPPTQTGTIAATQTPKPTASVVPCKDGGDQEDSVLSTSQKGGGDDDCETEVPRMARTLRPTEGTKMTRTPRPTEGTRMTKTPKPTEGARMTRTPKATESQRMTRTPKPTESQHMTRTPRPTEGSGGSDSGSRKGDHTQGPSSSNWIQVLWSDLQSAFRRHH